MIEDLHPLSFILMQEGFDSMMFSGSESVDGDAIMEQIAYICIKYFPEYVANFNFLFTQIVHKSTVINQSDEGIKARQVFS